MEVSEKYYRQELLDMPHPHSGGGIKVYRARTKWANPGQAFDELEVVVDHMTTDGPSRFSICLTLAEAHILGVVLSQGLR